MSLVLTAIGAASGDVAFVAEKKMYAVPWLEMFSRALSMNYSGTLSHELYYF